MTLTTMPRPATRTRDSAAVTMKAFVYQGPGKKALEERPKPEITAATDAIVKTIKTTICGTDLHILKGDGGFDTPSRARARVEIIMMKIPPCGRLSEQALNASRRIK
ncbi:MAG: hypothetical protein WBW31_03950 [Candidatus Sulfotelmatobacter sp.]